MSQTIVQVENLNLSYKSIRAVRDVSFSVEQGEILAVIGRNGSGKTSTVECIEGLRKPDSGLIRILGKDPWLRRGEVYKYMGVSLQEAQYPSKIRVEELCGLFASFYENPADWKRLLTQMGLDEKRKRPVCKLSGGERQRLSIILSLIGRPKLLVADELTTGLDPEIRQNMLISFENIKRSGVAVIMVSHYLDEVEALADRILYLESGKQQYLGSVQGFRDYVKEHIPDNEWKEGQSLEKLYLMLAPRASGIAAGDIL